MTTVAKGDEKAVFASVNSDFSFLQKIFIWIENNESDTSMSDCSPPPKLHCTSALKEVSKPKQENGNNLANFNNKYIPLTPGLNM